MRPTLLATTLLALALAGPAAAQRSLFDQPVQNPADSPAPAAPAPRSAAPAPSAPGPPAPAAAAPAPSEEPAPARPRKAKAKPRGPVPARSLAVLNATPTTLVGLEVSQGGRAAKLKKPLASGKKTRLALPAFKACEVSVTASFDGQAAGQPNPVDICKEKSLNFRE